MPRNPILHKMQFIGNYRNPFSSCADGLLSELAFILPPEVLQLTSNLTYQDQGGDSRNQRSLEDIYISSCNYLAEIIIDIKNC